MTPAELRSIGEKLYGPRWQTKLAEVLPVSTRTIRYWLSGDQKRCGRSSHVESSRW